MHLNDSGGYMEQNLKINRKSAADLVCDKIKELIINETWHAGEKIPTEIELAQNFGVNRLTVRIGLQRLNTLGLLDIRVGDGTYVKQFDMNAQISEMAEFYINEETLHNVSEYRVMLELGCVKQILERYTADELEKFRLLCNKFHEELKQYYEQEDPKLAKDFLLKTVDTTVELHTVLIDMAHNDLMRYAFTLAKEPMRRHMYYNASQRLQDFDENQNNIWAKQWQKLYEVLRDKDEDLFREILQKIIIL